MTSDISFGTVEELDSLLRTGSASSVDLTTHFLQRLETLGPRYNALASLTRERALVEATQADAARQAGRDGPLLGIPYGAKDVLAATGAPTTYGSAAYKDQHLDFDATAIARLRGAGAVLIGKLALMELVGFGAWTPDSSLFGPGISPWGEGLWASGSSNGSGSAVAAGLAPFALGSETGGSIAGPSAYCGITGLRPTYGLVSRHGALPLSWTTDKIGPMAHSAWDCGLVLEAIAGPDLHDRSTSRSFAMADVNKASIEISQTRLGFARSDFEETADSAIRPALQAVLQEFTNLGLDLIETELPKFPYYAVYYLITHAEGGSALAPLLESDALWKVTRRDQTAYIRGSLDITARDYIDATRVRSQIREAFREIFRKVDAIVSFTEPRAPTSTLEDLTPFEETRGNAALIVAGNLAGLPGLFLPCGFTSQGLPVGVQVVGPPFSEARLISIGRLFQDATEWHRARPQV